MIFVVVPCAVIGLQATTGEIHGWVDLGKAFDHGLVGGALTAIGWLGMRSPLAQRVHTLLGTEQVTKADGSTTTTKVEIEKVEPLPPDRTGTK